MPLNCLIIDDEPVAQEIVEGYIDLLPDLKIAAKCNNAVEAFTALHANDIDLIFLDIQMPEINGLELVRSLNKVPLIVFTTADPSFALDGFDLGAVDYLLKPISMERFLRAIEKIYSMRSQKVNHILNEKIYPERSFFFINSDAGLTRVDYNSILYIEGLENYIKIICEHQTIISHNTMKSIESVLPSENFLRIHRSYLVNLNKVESVKDYLFKIKNKTIATGKSYKKSIQHILKQKYAIIGQ